MSKIIIVQTNSASTFLAGEVVSELGVARDVRLLTYFNERTLKVLIDREQKQLLITGTDRGNPEPVVNTVSHFREAFPNLTCVSFAVTSMPAPPFHGVIEKSTTGSRRALKMTIKKFLRNGTV